MISEEVELFLLILTNFSYLLLKFFLKAKVVYVIIATTSRYFYALGGVRQAGLESQSLLWRSSAEGRVLRAIPH